MSAVVLDFDDERWRRRGISARLPDVRQASPDPFTPAGMIRFGLACWCLYAAGLMVAWARWILTEGGSFGTG